MALERIVEMANQIGDFFAPYPPGQAPRASATTSGPTGIHACATELLALVDAGGAGLAPHVIEAAKLLREEAPREARLLRASEGAQHLPLKSSQ